MLKSLLKSRYATLFSFIGYYIVASFLVRLILTLLSFSAISDSLGQVLAAFFIGLSFDISVAFCFSIVYSLYLLFFPSKFVGSFIDKVLSYIIISLMFFITLFSFAAEFPFWDEFKTRFNFIAVDYLIYTYEVIENINQSYPIPLIVASLLAVIFLLYFIFYKTKTFHHTFTNQMRFKKRAALTLIVMVVGLGSVTLLKNDYSEFSNNVYTNELSKNGVFSFFYAFKSNELDYNKFYPTLSDEDAYAIIKKELASNGENYTNTNFDNITRQIAGDNSDAPNIVLICIESLSADFLARFGNTENLMPYFEELAEESIYFTNVFATGTRTVRGMEALVLSVPPTPGNSIVRRPKNDNLFSIATVLKRKNYDMSFIYGGDGYFDNMNAFFGGQGFTIVDRNRGNPLPDNIRTERINIDDSAVTFENAWGICDEDIYTQALKRAKEQNAIGKPFFQFIMTTSNHKPYTFPEGKIDMPQGSRESAVKYTDYALGNFIKQAKNEDWYENTIFLIIADHCASSAGRWEINTEKHHIPAIIYNMKNHPTGEVDKLVSQIDITPTLFSLLGWEYQSALYGKDIFSMKPEDERALIGNYRTLGLLQNGFFTQVNDRKETKQFSYNPEDKTIQEEVSSVSQKLKDLTISYYQTASERFKNGKMKEDKN
jgi:phosphoglycerol transferase MdoB-like AlkP superfamily enzyme